jgi:probable HAF family extracellular repeat protein
MQYLSFQKQEMRMSIRGITALLLNWGSFIFTIASVLAVSYPAPAGVFSGNTDGFLDTGGNFTPIDYPGADFERPSGINNAGQIVGWFSLGILSGTHGFLYSSGNFTQIDVPGAFPSSTEAFGINDAGQIVGLFNNSTGTHGFLDTDGRFTQIDVPGAGETEAFGINSTGQIVGEFLDKKGGEHGFLDSGGSFTQIDVPGSGTEAFGINDAGQIVGLPGFLDTGGSVTRIDVPDATFGTQAFAINDMGQIVGSFTRGCCSYTTGLHGFLDSGGSFTQIDVPGSIDTEAYGINDAGQIVGLTIGASGAQGVPEPTSLALLGGAIGLTGFAMLRRRKVSTQTRGGCNEA